ncbi:MAG: CPXCG motif-containing cysteine-rich protein [Gammaproteobacteria bacterium]|nr:CPXCG motif-containing cysteine-rich protein [Gammaproteobacteria bacterium]MDH5734485.1 CPXCG motif-containing cysteine-rich protein [Gammaproteobacteria bacterium]
MLPIESVKIQCPHCWEDIDINVDCSVENQEYTEDCEVCCKPIRLTISCQGNTLPTVDAQREYD